MISGINSYSSIAQTQQTSAPSQPVQAKEAPALSTPNESVDIRPQTKMEKMMAATADKAAKLEATLGEHVPGQVIVKTKPNMMRTMESFAGRYGAEVIEKFNFGEARSMAPQGEMMQLKLPEGMTTAQAMALMSEDPSIEYAVPNNIYHKEEPVSRESVPNDTISGKASNGQKMPNDLKPDLWGLNNDGQNGGKVDADIDAPEAWQKTTGSPNGNGPIIAILDTGADINHPDLVNNIWTNPGEIAGDGIDNDGNGVIDDVHGYNSFSNDGNCMDCDEHGTHVAGTIAAEGNNGQGVVGINWQATIMPVRIFGDDGGADTASIIRGINYATANGARVTSSSWGGGGANEAIKEAFQRSSALHIMSAGNSGSNNDVRPHYPSDYDIDNNVCVAASDRNDKLAYFSCYGEKNVDIAAPGVDILSTVPGGGYAKMSGTSMATPHVTGAVGLLLAQDPTMSNDEIKARLFDGSDKLESLSGKVATGGRLNINNAMEMEYHQSGTQKA